MAGLKPTILCIKYTRTIAIANKESIICAWKIINSNLKKHKTNFIPVDSEHFSLWKIINKKNKSNIDKIYITASGGPFLKYTKKRLKHVKPHEAIKHPNWKMGKKISIDSSTMMNKVFELIEASKIFDIKLNKFEILIHPKSYVHAIVKFKNGIIKFIAHETDMSIPIANSIYYNENLVLKKSNISLVNLNNLNFTKPDLEKYPAIKLLKYSSRHNTLFETALISINDELVNQFLNHKIKYMDINSYLLKILKHPKIKKSYIKKISNFNKIDEFKKIVTITTKDYVQNKKIN